MLHHRLRAASGRDSGGGGIPTDYIAFYTMDNIIGNALIDETGNYDGTIYGATQVPGYVGDALSFSGSDYVLIGSRMGVAPNETSMTLTVSAWIYLDSLSPPEVGHIFGDYDRGAVRGFFLGQDAVGAISATYIDLSLVSSNSGKVAAVPAGTWFHCLAEYTPTGVNLEIDGVVQNSIVGQASTSQSYTSSRDMVLGAQAYSGGYATERRFRGVVDEFQVFTRLLSSAEKEALRNV